MKHDRTKAAVLAKMLKATPQFSGHIVMMFAGTPEEEKAIEVLKDWRNMCVLHEHQDQVDNIIAALESA